MSSENIADEAPTKDVNINFFMVHGSMLWTSWGLLSILQIASNRYMKANWESYHWIHRLVGMTMVVITIFYATYSFGYLGWNILNNWHSYFVFPILFLILFIAAGGIITRSCLRR